MGRKNNFDAGYTVTPVEPKKTAIDRFAMVAELVGADQAEQSVSQRPAVTPAHSQPPANGLTPVDGKDTFSPEFLAWCERKGYQPGSVIELPLGSVKSSPFNPRHFYRKSSIAALALNLSSEGQQNPIHVTPDYLNDAEFFVHDGGRRTRALREINEATVKAIVVDVPQGIKSYKLGYNLNTQHETQTAFDNAVVWKRLLDEKHFPSNAALAEELGIDKSMVTMTLSVNELPSSLLEEMVDNAHAFGETMAYSLVKHYRSKGEKATAALVRRVIAEGLSVRKVADLVRKATDETEGDKRARARYVERREIKFFGDVHVGDLRTYGDDRLALELRGLSREQRDRVQERIEAVLAEEGRGQDTLV
ncbi:ParB/RepB/Spo0J family partition protein [Burkholderia sp. Bp9125]|nr:ParB/RepB/Spo0J family partition protein [Burkholderia sp. Bp9125]